MSAVWDRDAAREVLREYGLGPREHEELYLDALEACMRPAPPQSGSREPSSEQVETFKKAWEAEDVRQWALGLEEPHEGERTRAGLRAVFALPRPIEGVVLTPEEADTARRIFTVYARVFPDDRRLVALGKRLEATS